MKIEIFCDGSATTIQHPGGYGWVLVVDGAKHSEGNGHIKKATNNDAELEAAVQGLVAVYKFVTALELDPKEYTVKLCSDSQIVLGWADGTYRCKQESKQVRLRALVRLMHKLHAKTQWIEGHSGHIHNERCDRLANLGRLGLGSEDALPGKKSKKKKNQHETDVSDKTKIGKNKKNTICLWHKGVLKIVDLESNAVEDYDQLLHGYRESYLEVK